MDWPRFQLTRGESEFNCKYEDPRKRQQRVLRRFYYNELNISTQIRQDMGTFQISRRSRVVGMTFSGDTDAFKIEIIDVTGEQYTAGPTHVPLLCQGWNQDPRSLFALDTGAAKVAGNEMAITTGTLGPYIFEPNIVVAPNQTIQINSAPQNADNVENTFILGIVMHVVEFPGAPGSPL